MKDVMVFWIDLAIAVAFLAFAMVNIIPLSIAWNTPITDVIEDKTMRSAILSGAEGDDSRTGYDLLFSLMIADEYTPYPKSIKINDTPIIDFVPEWYTQKSSQVNKIYSATGDWKLVNLLDKGIKSVDYVDNGGDPYWHFILE